MNIPSFNLEQLKIKKVPNNKKGIKVNIVKPKEAITETDVEAIPEVARNQKLVQTEPVQEQVSDSFEPYELIGPAKLIKIHDGRDKKKIDRNMILDRIHQRRLIKSPKSDVSLQKESNKQELAVQKEVDEEKQLVEDPNIDEDSLFRLQPNVVQSTALDLNPPGKSIVIKKKAKKITNEEAVVAATEAKEIANEVAPVKIIKKRKIVRVDIPPTKIDFMAAKIGSNLVIDRLPKAKDKVIIQASNYYMNNRKLFVKQLADLFRPYRDELAANAENISCKSQSKSKDFELLTHQKIVRDYLNLYTPYRGLLLYHGLGSGKCLKYDTPLIMSDGSIKMVQNILKGDLLMGDDSLPRTVTSLARGVDKMYDIVQPTTCEKYTVNSEHILCLKAVGFPRMEYKEKIQNGVLCGLNTVEWIDSSTDSSTDSNRLCKKIFTESVTSDSLLAKTFFENIKQNPQTNGDILEIAVKDYLKLSAKQQSLLRGYKVPVEFPEQVTPINSYILGFWLTAKQKLNTQKNQLYNNKFNDYAIIIDNYNKYGGKLCKGSIPHEYKCNSRANRMQLLAGIIDGNGYLFSYTDIIIEDVLYLARSLGIACYKKENSKNQYKLIVNDTNELMQYQLPNNPNNPNQPNIQKPRQDELTYKISVESVGEDNYYGFTLDGNCRFLLGDFSVTHNTCTSIALAEGMKSHKRVFVMTPASLKMNFFSELKKCGDALYKKNQFWEFISTDGKPDYIQILAKAVQIPADYVQSNKGAWLVDISKAANFAELSTEEQRVIDEQLNLMIRSKYTDINYNGLNQNKLALLTGDFTRNPFDDSIVIIDEAHNFVSRIVNKLPKTLTAAAGAVAAKSISYMLYEYLMDARNARVVLLTGTPIINYPNEIGILFNILRGYIKTWVFPVRVKTTNAVNRDTILDMFDAENFRTFDYVEYSGNKLTITRNPFGFINTKKRGAAKGAVRRGGSRKHKKQISKPAKNKTKKQTNSDLVTTHLEDGVYTIKNGVIVENKELMVEINEVRNDESADTISVFDQYYKDKYASEEAPQYGGGAIRETSSQYGANHDKHQNGINKDTSLYGGEGSDVFDRYNGVHLDETGNITDGEFVATIKRILGKNDIDIIESGIEVINNKALPDDSETFMEKFIEVGATEMKNENVFKKRILGLTSYFRSAQEKLLPNYILNEQGGIFNVVRTEMSDYQFGIYEQIRKVEEDRESNIRKKKRQQAKKGELFQVASTYRIFSRACCNFAFPDPPGRPLPDKQTKKQDEEVDENDFDAVPANLQTQNDDYATEEDVQAKRSEEGETLDYQHRIERAMKHLEYNASQTRDEEFLTPEGLEIYSPKFLSILENLQDEDNRGLHLLYSQFRTIEGIGLLKLILEANGFAEFKIQKGSEDSWSIVELPGKEDLPKFVLYTGTETAEEKEIVRNIYNGDWEYVPASITAKLREKAENNMYGEIIKILMITASGAEGINLKNTRFVHIVEPYWHMVRIEQVIGRARRICSHEDLPEELRNIKVFLYLSILPQDLKTDRAKFTKHIELLNRDTSRLDGKISLTTDESLFESATIKDSINRQILTAMKETAMDCSLYAKGNREGNQSEDLVCYGYGKVESNQFGSYPTLEQDQGERDDVNVKKQKLKLSNVTLKGVKYAWNEATNELFDYESFQRAKKTGEDMLYVGRLVRDGPRKFHIDTETGRV